MVNTSTYVGSLQNLSLLIWYMHVDHVRTQGAEESYLTVFGVKFTAQLYVIEQCKHAIVLRVC